MQQGQADIDSNTIKQVIHLLNHGSSEEWKQLYRQYHFAEVMPKRCCNARRMEYTYEERHRLYEYVNEVFIGNAPIDYLEFGVACGNSMKRWSSINQHPGSRFYGFDSFQGLPEDWHNDPKGAYTQNGNIPKIDDDRVSFIDGLFQDTIDDFSQNFELKNRLVMHMDADLYSSTLYALMNFNRHIKPETIILFDEFTSRNCTDEFAALLDYCAACYREFEVLATRNDHVKLAIKITK